MADQIKELIEKINQEGVQAAEEKVRDIEQQAQQKAELILQKAAAQAKKMIDEAEEKIDSMQASSRAALQQAGRDMLLTLRQDMLALLQKLVAAETAAVLSAEELSKIIGALISGYCAQGASSAVIYLSEQDKSRLEGHFLNKLKHELKNGFEIRSQADIRAGFRISFDDGKSHFDFTDTALAEYIGTSLKSRVAELLKGI